MADSDSLRRRMVERDLAGRGISDTLVLEAMAEVPRLTERRVRPPALLATFAGPAPSECHLSVPVIVITCYP